MTKKEIEHYWNKFSERFYFEDGTCEELIDKDYFIAAMMEFSTNLSMEKCREDASECCGCGHQSLFTARTDHKCPNCGGEDFESICTEAWATLTDEEKERIIQYEEDCDWYNSVR